MRFMLNAQTAGSLIVVGAFVASEAAVMLLSIYPGSTFAWYLNIEVFRPFELARSDLSPLGWCFTQASLLAGLGMAGLILFVRKIGSRFGVALCANIAFVFTAFLAYTSINSKDHQNTASLLSTDLPPNAERLLMVSMIAASVAAFAISHLSFMIAIRRTRSNTELSKTGIALRYGLQK